MSHFILNAIAITFIVLTSQAYAQVNHISNEQTQALLKQGVPLIDVRLEREWKKTGVIEGSHLVTFFDERGNYDTDKFIAEIEKLAGKDKPFMLICAVGGRTGRISQFLDNTLGYSQVHNVENGIKHWIKAGKPIVEYSSITTE